MSLATVLRLGRLLARVARPQDPSAPAPADVEELVAQVAPGGGLVYNLYQPRGRPLGSVVVLHGATVRHRSDHRLVHFARSLAQGGVVCVAPTLPGMAACRFEAADIDVVGAALAEAQRVTGTRAGLLGFSLGGTYGLLAAARAPAACAPRFAVTFGAYHDMARLLQQSVELTEREPHTALQWDQAVYLRLALAHGYPEVVGLPADTQAAVAELLGRYCAGVSLAEKQAFYERTLRGLAIVGPVVRSLEPGAVATLSAAGQLTGLRCPVSLIHDRHDAAVPLDHLEPLWAELPARTAGGPGHRKVLTSLLSHVSLSGGLRLAEVWRLCAALAPVVVPGPVVVERARGASEGPAPAEEP